MCPYCVKVCRALQLAEIEHVIYKLDRDFTREEFYDKFGQGSTFPRVLADDIVIGGCTETVKYLREHKLL
jgi:glutaredoxin